MVLSVFDHLRFQARQRPHALSVFGPAGTVTYEALADDVESLATELVEREIGRHDMVGLQFGFSYLHLLLILALDRLSVPSQSFATRGSVPAGPELRAQFDVTVMIAADAASADPGCRWIEMSERARPKLGKADLARLACIDSKPTDVVRLSWSSGTTGGLKGTAMSRAVQAHRLTNRRLIRGMGPQTRYFTGMPLSSATGYAMALAVLASGGAVILPGLADDFVTAANTLGVTLTSGAPGMLLDLLGRQGSAVRRLETIECFEVLGEHLPAKLAQDARLFLTPNLSLVYGSTEADRVAIAEATIGIADPSAVGFVSPLIEAEIVDDAGRALAAGHEGRLRVRGDQVVAGYYKNDAATRRHFQDGWFYPGDVGAITGDGLLRITGRVEDVIVRDAAVIAPQPIEAAINALPQVREAAVFPMPGAGGAQEIWAAVVLEPGADPRAVAEAVQLGDRTPARLLVIDRLPRNASGKIVRRMLVEWATRSRPP
jgi:acyl-CoA synthetase (AMP-forming)/AMP-acid ligase II